MQLNFLGTSGAKSLPLFRSQHPQSVAARQDPSRRRHPSCAYVEAEGWGLLLDAGRFDVGELLEDKPFRGVCVTHFHPDHVQGLFPLRWAAGEPFPVFAPQDEVGCADLTTWSSRLDWRRVEPFQTIDFGPFVLTPVPLNHEPCCLGWCVETPAARFAWLTDTSGLPTETLAYLRGWQPDAIAIDCTYPPRETPHPAHNDLTQVLRIHAQLAPETTWLLHLNEAILQWLEEHPDALPEGVALPVENQPLSLIHRGNLTLKS